MRLNTSECPVGVGIQSDEMAMCYGDCFGAGPDRHTRRAALFGAYRTIQQAMFTVTFPRCVLSWGVDVHVRSNVRGSHKWELDTRTGKR